MAGFLHKLVNFRQRYSILKGPVVGLTVVGITVYFGLFSSEQFFGQLDTSRTLVQIDKRLLELELIESQLANIQIQEVKYFLWKDEDTAKAFLAACNVLHNHLNDLAAFQTIEPSLSDKLEDTTRRIEELIKLSKDLVENYRSHNLLPTSDEKDREAAFIESANRVIAEMISSQTRLCQTYLDRTQTAAITALIFIMLFRTALIIIFVLALLFAHRYLFEKKRLETLLAGVETKFSVLFETALDGIFTLNADGTIESANAAMQKMFGMEAEELIGKNISVIMPQFFSEVELPLSISSLNSNDKKVINPVRETVGLHKDGRTIPVELSVNVLELEDRQILSGIVRDITERKESQQRLKDFYSNVSHELRTPLTSIRTALGLIEHGVVGALTSETAPVLQIAQSEADRLIRMINDLLDIRRIEEGKFSLHLDNVLARALIETAIDAVSSLVGESKVELVSEISSSSPLYCDSDRIVQVLTNFLSNAIKFSPPETKIITSAQEADGKVLFAVIDFGAGISQEQLPLLFGRFEQLDSASERPKHGSGLGLFISKTIVEHHGGSIGVDISSKGSTRFWFELPISPIT